MDRRIGGVTSVKAGNKAISDTYATRDMDPNYGYFMYYHHYYIGEYINLGNGSK